MQPPVSSIRSVLGGFAGLLILMGCLAVDSAKQTHDVSVTSAALRKESRDRDELLDQLRTDTYRSATLVRDYILEPDDVLAASQKPLTAGTTCHDRITRNFPAAGFDHRCRRCRGIGHRRGSGHRHIDARVGGQGVAGQRKVSGHPEGGATLRKLHSV